jgi:type II secretory pathway component GspD/PulD (secretin)
MATTLLLLAGCTSPQAPEIEPVPPPPPAPEVVAAEKLFESGKMQDAIIACIDISKKNPEALGLTDLQQRITHKLADERLAAAEKKAEATVDLHSADASRFGVSPETYRLQKHVVGDNTSLRTAPTAMQKVLANPVSIHLINADINAIIAQIGQSQNINIIADSEISPKTITIHAENTPLMEILEYIGRNLNVTFSVGNNLIWVTPKEETSTGVPLETRVYRLRKGLLGSELGKSAQGVSLFKGPEERGGGRSSNQNQPEEKEQKEGKVGLLESIERFVPQPEGADFLFNDKVHALVVKNTRENLALVEDLISAMDVRPLQVLIEARFVTTSISDLRELGIEWLLDNRGYSRFSSGQINTDDPWVRGKTKLTQARRDVVSAAFQGVSDDGSGGASVAYQFLLGDTALQAVLHALEKTGQSRTIVVPRVTTLNNREARFRVGEDTSYFEEVDTNIMTSGGGYGDSSNQRDNVTYDYNTPTIVETGYSLIVTPSVGADLSAINMVLRPEISSIKEWKKYQLSSLGSNVEGKEEPAIEVPVLSRQYIETEAVVRSGETVVLGGLADTQKKNEISGTPWLMDLPFIGHLFRTEKDKEHVQNILIFVTATLISDVGEELIPLNNIERYGLAVPAEAKVPDVLKGEPAAPAVPAAEAPSPAPTPAPVPAATAVEAAPAAPAPAP